MINHYDIAYWIGVGVAAPVWLARPSARRKVLRALRERMGHVPDRRGDAPAILIHAVSLGEMNATRGLLERLARLRPGLRIIISTTTDTGFARAQELYGKSEGVTIIRYPLDFTPAVTRVLDRLRPSLIVLMELEIWPNFIRQCHKRGVPVVLLNGRMTRPSYQRYRLIRPIVAGMFNRLALLCVQDPNYADWFAALGAPRERIQITGTMKFDTATVADSIPGADELAKAVGLENGPVWVCGSTGPGEEKLILDQYRELLKQTPALRLAIIPRHPERFDDVARIITAAGFALLRRSQTAGQSAQGANYVILGDTMGELRKFYSLADAVFVGRTLVDLGPRQHGSDMIEPAALAKPTIVGPFAGNFSEPMNRLREAKAIIEVNSGPGLAKAVEALLTDRESATQMARRAQQVVVSNKGATDQHVQAILSHLK